ncbi:MAG: TrmH family RNA methyltransferase [Terriglobales bacterium]|jgi:tRNA/rRNA methyltransferase
MNPDLLCVVLVAARNPLNIGAAARAMSNFGFSRLRVVNPYSVAFRQAKSAVGASAVLADAEEFTSVAEAVADCNLVVGTTALRKREPNHPLRRLDRGALLIRKQLVAGRVALLFGSEKFGLSNQDLSHCQWLLHIPTREEHLSMNLGQSVAVCLYELRRGVPLKNAKPAARANGTAHTRPANSEMLERITDVLLAALRESGYVKPGLTDSPQEKARRLVRRLDLTAGDAAVWMGMLRQILWSMEHPKGH